MRGVIDRILTCQGKDGRSELAKQIHERYRMSGSYRQQSQQYTVGQKKCKSTERRRKTKRNKE